MAQNWRRDTKIGAFEQLVEEEAFLQVLPKRQTHLSNMYSTKEQRLSLLIDSYPDVGERGRQSTSRLSRLRFSLTL